MKRLQLIFSAVLLIAGFCTAAAYAASDAPESIIIQPSSNTNTAVNAKKASANTTAAEKKQVDHTAQSADHQKGDAAAAGIPNTNDKDFGNIIMNPTQADLPVAPFAVKPLTERDFTIGTIGAGDDLNQVERVFGNPMKYSVSEHYTTLRYAGDTLGLRVILRNDTPSIIRQHGETDRSGDVGVNAVFLAQGANIVIGRGIHLGDPMEVVVRRYGIPSKILRDVDANVYYVVYTSPQQDRMLVFAICERKVARVALMPPRPPYTDSVAAADFSLMGFSLGDTFQANKYNMWTSMIKGKENQVWMYGDYGVEVDRHNTITKVFLLNNNAYTSRGATLGYNVSTVLTLYGLPQRMEKGPGGEKSVDGYFYDDPDRQGSSLLFVVNKNNYVSDVLLTDSSLTDIQDPKKRYDIG